MPRFVVNPKIARRALEKQRTDEVEYAQLLKDNVPAAPIYRGLDGGMNKVFLARFPGRVTLAKVLPYASYLPQLPPVVFRRLGVFFPSLRVLKTHRRFMPLRSPPGSPEGRAP